MSATARPALRSGAPAQFGGDGSAWSPEELLVGAVLACLKTTFDAYARARALEVQEWRAAADGILEKTRTGPAFAGIHVTLDVQVAAGSEEQAREVVQRAARDCIISRAVKAPVAVVATINGAQLTVSEAL